MSSTSGGKASLSSTNSKMYVGSSTYFSSEVFPFIKLSQTVLLQAELWCSRSGAPGFLRPSCRGRRCQGRAQGASPGGESAVMPIYKSLKSGASFHFYIYCARPLKYAHLTKERCTLTRCAPGRWTDFVKLFSHSNEICFWGENNSGLLDHFKRCIFREPWARIWTYKTSANNVQMNLASIIPVNWTLNFLALYYII